jgi:hypothetical protein
MRVRARSVVAAALLLPATVTVTVAALAAGDDRAAAARAAADSYQAQLRGELLKALKEGGPAGAITVCRDKAPQIAAAMGKETGWRIGRTGARVRNPANAPDEWEAKVLADFEARVAKGENVIRMEHGEEVALPDGKRVFRYMKAIPMGEACQKCHGASIDTALAARIRAIYPQDQAVGFATGQLRGAFTITQPLP